MSRLSFSIILCLFGLSSVLATDATYHKVTALNGDGVYTLLRRYELLDEYCNVLQFYKLSVKERRTVADRKKVLHSNSGLQVRWQQYKVKYRQQ